MVAVTLAILLVISDAALPSPATGIVQGAVVDGSRGGALMEGVDVVLRAGTGGELVPVAQSTTDLYGKFVFSRLPIEPNLEYVAGADRDGVHYPGQRVQLGPNGLLGHVRIVTYEAVAAPCPLVALRHKMDVLVQHDVMEITESIAISNPTQQTFVGQKAGDELPVTLQLSLPRDFDRVTFDSEFYGRRFRVVDGRLVTDIPWPPGRREVRFTYRVPVHESGGVLRRLLDLPTSDVTVRAQGGQATLASCNLPKSSVDSHGITFGGVNSQLAAGHAIELRLGKLPIPWGAYGRWSALGLLAALVVATMLFDRRRAGRCDAARSGRPSAPVDHGRRSAPGARTGRAA
jgi:hypothetical protein